MTKYTLYSFVVLLIPVDLGHGHQHRQVIAHGIVEFRVGSGERNIISLILGIAHELGCLANAFGNFLAKTIKLGQGIVRTCRSQERCIQKLEQLFREQLVRQICILGEQRGGKVFVSILQIQEQNVRKRLRWITRGRIRH